MLGRRELLAEPTIQDGLVSVDAAIAKEGPVAAGFFTLARIAFDDEDFFFVVRSFGENAAEGISDERVAPKFEAGVALLRFAFVADAIDDRDIDAIRDGVSTLDRTPRVKLRRAELCFFVRMPADTCGIENDLSALKRSEARTFRIPLVPADLNADAAIGGIKIGEAKVAGREIKLFVVKRIVGNMHFAVFAEERAVGVDDGARVVIDAGRAAFEKGGDEDDFAFLGDFCESLGGRAGNRLGKIEKFGVFREAEILAEK